MGCDIHLFVEHRDRNGRWWKCKDGFKSDMFEEDSEYFSQSRFSDGDSPYGSRNYTVFAYLADVRNGYGFAGCDTGDAITPISEPRGLPDDVSLSIQEESDSWGEDGHSHSYFTLGELRKAFEDSKNIMLIQRGWVSKSEYEDFKANGEPNSWCGGVSGGDIKHISNEEMERKIKENNASDKINYYTQIEWKKPLSEVVKYFFEHVISQLEKWDYDDREDDEIRIVFWFDN